VSVVGGIPTTSVARTLLDCAAVLKVRAVEKMIGAAADLNVFDLGEVQDLLEFVTGHPGRGVLKNALGMAAVARGRTRSVYEDDLLEAFRMVGTGEPECNLPLFLPSGEVVYPDFLWRRGALVVEADPRSTHDATASYRSDRERDRKLDAIGLQTMRFHDLDLLEPGACAQETMRRLSERRRQGHEFRPLSGRNS